MLFLLFIHIYIEIIQFKKSINFWTAMPWDLAVSQGVHYGTHEAWFGGHYDPIVRPLGVLDKFLSLFNDYSALYKV